MSGEVLPGPGSRHSRRRPTRGPDVTHAARRRVLLLDRLREIGRGRQVAHGGVDVVTEPRKVNHGGETDAGAAPLIRTRDTDVSSATVSGLLARARAQAPLRYHAASPNETSP